MTDNQREIYLFLLMCGREAEAIQYRDNCNVEEILDSSNKDAANNEND